MEQKLIHEWNIIAILLILEEFYRLQSIRF
jgi:hypothetical protein